MNLDNIIFKMINSCSIPSIFDEIFLYLHGFINVEIVFFLFCSTLFLIVIIVPKKGPKVGGAAFIITMITYFGMDNLKKLLVRPYPSLDGVSEVIFRVEIVRSSSAFPVMSTLIFSAVIMSMMFYFQRYSTVFILISLIYAVIPIYLGVAYPSDAFGSAILGYILGYFLMQFLSKIQYFSRYK